MGWAIMLGHSGWEQKLRSDFKVLGGGGRRIRNDLETFAEVDFWHCPGKSERDLTFIQHLYVPCRCSGGQQFISNVV